MNHMYLRLVFSCLFILSSNKYLLRV
jgi:hypothetical protein